jgi:hypothetical protein
MIVLRTHSGSYKAEQVSTELKRNLLWLNVKDALGVKPVGKKQTLIQANLFDDSVVDVTWKFFVEESNGA